MTISLFDLQLHGQKLPKDMLLETQVVAICENSALHCPHLLPPAVPPDAGQDMNAATTDATNVLLLNI